MLTLHEFAGWQSTWGCRAWNLWITYLPAVVPTLLSWDVHNLLFDWINNQEVVVVDSRKKEVPIGTSVSTVSTCVTFELWMMRWLQTLSAIAGVRDPGATTLAALPNVASDCTRNITICLEDSRTLSDEHINVSRTYFDVGLFHCLAHCVASPGVGGKNCNQPYYFYWPCNCYRIA